MMGFLYLVIIIQETSHKHYTFTIAYYLLLEPKPVCYLCHARGYARYHGQTGHSINVSGFKILVHMRYLYLMIIILAISHKHFAFTVT